MVQRELVRLLAEWRAAEADWEQTPGDDPAMPAAREAVLRAWEAYNRAAGSFAPEEIVLVADDAMRYAAAYGPTEEILGLPNAHIAGLGVADLTPDTGLAEMAERWKAFVLAGRMDGEYVLRGAGGRVVRTRFQARAHHPVSGLHTARHWPIERP